MKRNLFLYFLVISIFSLLIWVSITEWDFIFREQNQTHKFKISKTISEQPSAKKYSTSNSDNLGSVLDGIKKKLAHPISILLLQIIVIVIFARILGLLFGKLGQPTVIGEILAGILLGPSLLGHLFPEFTEFLFPDSSMDNLSILSQVGLVLFMFVIGLELDLRLLKQKITSAVFISHTSIVVSFFTGIILAAILFSSYSPPTSFSAFAMFIGIAMSIAAFPVLARIVQEKGMTKTPLGKNIITIAAIDDITAWCLLAVVIALIQAGSIAEAFYTIALTLLYIIAMLIVAQPLMKRVGNYYITKEIVDKKIVALVFVLIFVSAFFTEIIGIKALFGGFLAGVIMPQNIKFKKIMAEKIEDFSLVVLLPLFFVFTGLRTNFGLINQSDLWLMCLLITGFAIIGKLGSSFIAAKLTGQSWKNSLIIGTLMNTRGLMQLIVLNIGYDMGILTPQIFAMMVVMTLITTFMTGPTLKLIEKIYAIKEKNNLLKNNLPKYCLAFGLPATGTGLLRLTSNFVTKSVSEKSIIALHMTPNTEISHTDALKYEITSFAPIKKESTQLKIPIDTIYKTSDDVSREIILTVNKLKCELLIIGAAKSIFSKNIIGGKVKAIIKQSKCNVGVFIDKDLNRLKKTLIISDDDSFYNMSGFSLLLLENSNSEIFIANSLQIIENYPDIASQISKNGNRMQIIKPDFENFEFYHSYDLIILNLRNFEKQFISNNALIESSASLLILNFYNDIYSEKINKAIIQ